MPGSSVFGGVWIVEGDQAALECVQGGLGAVGQVQLGEDVADVALDRALGDHEFTGDLLVAHPSGDQPQYVKLALAQAGQ